MNDTEKMNEAKPSAAKLVACNERSRARVAEIAHLANECLLNTNHPNGYEQGQFGKDYRTYGRAMCEIRKLVRESIADVAPDYEMLALQFARNSFDFAKFQEALAAVASMKAEDFPGVYYTPGWLVRFAKEQLGEAATGMSQPQAGAQARGGDIPVADAGADKDAKTADWFRKHYSFCDGLFPIRFTNTEDGQMASCWIGGRHFTLDLDNNERDDGGHDCAAIIRDNGKVVATIETQRGKAISGRVAYCAFKEYVRNLGGSGKLGSRGGFLKAAIKRAAAAKQQAHDNKGEAAKEVK